MEGRKRTGLFFPLKKILIISSILLALLAAAFLAVSTNVNRTKPAIERRLSEALGRPVKLGMLRLGWNGGTVFGTESLSIPPVELRHLSISVKNPGWSRPMDFKGSTQFFSDHRNLNFNGRITLGAKGKGGILDRFHLESDLKDLNRPKLKRAWPDLFKELDLARPLRGILTVDAGPVALDAEGAKTASVSARLEAGQIALERLKNPIQGINLDAVFGVREIRINSFDAELAGGKIEGKGTLEKNDIHTMSLEFTAENITLQDLVQGSPDKPQLMGKLFAGFKGASQAPSPERLIQNISGSGRIVLKDPVILRMNILRELLNHLAKLPGMAETLQNFLPPHTRLKLAEAQTVLQTIDLPFVIRMGAFHFDDLKIGTGEFLLAGKGRVTLDGTVAIQVWVVINAELSAVLMNGVREAAYFADPLGQIQIPVRIEGPLDKLQFKPDTEYIAKRVAVNKGQELLSDLLSKKDGSSAKDLLSKLI